jgi:hypothetical protein
MNAQALTVGVHQHVRGFLFMESSINPYIYSWNLPSTPTSRLCHALVVTAYQHPPDHELCRLTLTSNSVTPTLKVLMRLASTRVPVRPAGRTVATTRCAVTSTSAMVLIVQVTGRV